MKKIYKLLLTLSITTVVFNGLRAQVSLISPTGDGGFETGSTFAANNWTVVNPAAGTRSWYVGAAQSGFSGTAAAFIGDNATTTSTVTSSRTVHFYRSVTIPPGATNIVLSFKYKQAVADNTYDFLKVFLNGNTPVSGTAQTLGLVTTVDPVSSTSYSVFTAVTTTLSNTFGGTTNNLIFSFKADGVTPHAYGAVDDISLTYILPACPMPAAFNVFGITSSAATASWTPTGTETAWDVYYGSSPLAPPTATTVPTLTTAVTSYSLSSLTPNTSYSVYVRANCGGSTQSTWTAVKSFVTPCLTGTLPITEGFNATTIPSCWTRQFVSGTVDFQYGSTGSYPVPSAPFEGANMVYFNSGSYNSPYNQTRLVSPPVTTSALSAVDVDFEWYSTTDGGTTSYVTEGVTVQWSTDGLTWNDFPSNFTRRYSASNGWVKKTVALPPAAINQPNIFIGFLFSSNAGYSTYLDLASIHASPFVSNLVISPGGNICTATARSISSDVTPAASNLTSVMLNYSYNGVAQTPIPMTGGSLSSTSTWNATIPSATPINATVTWTVVATDGTYSKSMTGASYQDNPLLGVTAFATAAINPICAGNTGTLTATGPSTLAIGGGALTTSFSYASPFYHSYGGQKAQYLMLASELTAAGLYAGNLTSLSFDVASTGITYNGFAINLAQTANTNLSSGFVSTGLTQVYSNTVTPTLGINTYNFSTPIYWDGVSNIVVQICWSNNNYGGTGAEVKYDNTSFVSEAYYRVDNASVSAVCSNTATTGTMSSRPKMIFSGIKSLSAGYTFVWSDGSSTVGTSSQLLVNPTVNTTYSAILMDVNTCTISTAPLTLTVTPLPAIPSVASATMCGVGVSTASVTGGSSYNWYAAPTSTLVLQSGASSNYTASINTTTTFYVSSAVGACESPRAALTTTVSIPDAVTAITTAANICPGGSVVLSAVQSGTNNPYVFNWDSSPITGSGMPSTVSGSTVAVTPSIAGVYVYSVTASDGICTTISSVSVALNNPPVIMPTANPSVVCSGAAVNLNATTPVIAAGTKTVGAGSSTNSSGGSPFYHSWGGAKVQYIYTAAELIAQGFNPGNITSLGLNVTSVGIPYEGFAINVGTTTQSTFTSPNTINGLTQVYTGPGTNNSYLPTIGVNMFSFTSPIYWNGTDNIVVSICWSNATTGGTSSAVRWDTYSSNVGMYIYSDSQTPSTVCGATTSIPASGGSSTTTGRPQTSFSGQVNTFGAGNLVWEWNPGAINTNTAVVNPVNSGTLAANQVYTISGFNPITTCSNVATVTVTVNPLPATPSTVNSIQCGLAIPTAAVGGGTSYHWYAAPTSTLILQSGASSTFTSAINSTTDYYVSSFDGTCESVRAMVTASVTIPDLVTAVSTASAVCPGQSYTLTAVKTGTANTYNYTWTSTPATGSGLPTSVTGASPVISPLTPGNYSYLVTAVDGSCTATSSVDVLLNPTPSISASSTPTVVCSSNSVTLNAISIAATASTAPTGPVSFGSITGGPYRQGAGSDNKAQYLFTAAELTAAGFAPGNITALSFNVTFNGTGTMNNFTIRMGNTSTTSFGTTYDAAPAIVFGPVAYTTTAGLNTHTFTTPFYWNGTSNVVVQVCHDVVSGGGSSTIDQQTIANRVIYSNTSGACALTTGTSGSSRAVVTFAGQVGTNVTSSMNFLWSPSSIATSTAVVNPVNAGSTPITTVYSVTVTNPSTSCTNATTVGVLVNPIPVAPTAFNSIQCGVAVPTASVTGGIGYHWYNAATTGTLVQSGASQTFTNVISTPTDYYVASFDGNCESPRTMVTASVNIPDAVTASVLTASICPNTATTLTVTQTGSTNNYSYTWISIPTAGSGISTALTGSSVSVMPTLPGTYMYSVTAVDLACTAVSTTTLNVFQALTVAPLAVSSPSALCTGGTATLSGSFGGTLAPSYTAPPAVINQTADEDFGGIVFGPLTNTTSVNSLVGSIGTASGTAGSYSNFTAFGPYNFIAGSTYTLDLSSITTGTSYNNAFGVYIDYNRNGVFTDAGEAVYISGSTTSGPHTETALVTIPNLASFGLTRMRVICNEGLVSSPTMVVSYGEYEEYTLNILPNVAYTWSDGASVIGTTPTITQTPSTATTYSFAVIDPNGCAINSLPVTVNINPIPTVSVTASSPTVCANSPVILTGGGATTYTWAPAGGGSVTATVNPSVTTTYTVTGTSLGCSSTNTISLAVTPTPTVIATSSNSVICLGASVTFTASGAVNYTWTPGSASTTTISVTPTVTSTYSVTGEDLGCTTTKTLSVTVNRIPTLTVTPSSTICIGGSKTLNVSGATTYAWSTGSSAVAIVVSPTVSSTYTVSGTNSCGTSTATTMVSVASTPVISAVTSNTLLCVGETATLSVSGTATSYSWSAGGGSSSNIVVSPTSNTTYTVTGTSICGTATTTVIQNVSPCTSVQELASTQISLYPNPTTGFVNISMSRELLGGNTKIEVYDAIGKLVIVETLTNESTKLYTNKLEDGIYIYKVYDNNKIVTIGKLVKQ